MSSRRLTEEGRQCITLIERALQQAHIHYIDYSKLYNCPFSVLIVDHRNLLAGGSYIIVHFQASPSKVVGAYHQALVSLLFKAVKTSVLTFGKEPDKIITPLSSQQLLWLQQHGDDWAIFCSTVLSQFDNHYPPNKYGHLSYHCTHEEYVHLGAQGLLDFSFSFLWGHS